MDTNDTLMLILSTIAVFAVVFVFMIHPYNIYVL